MKARDSGMPPDACWETFFDPVGILTSLGLIGAEGPIVDIGSGYGTFTLAAARLTAQPVVAIDIEATFLDDLARKVDAEKLGNIRLVLRDVVRDGTGLPERYADIVLIFNLLHCDGPVDLLKEARRTLRPNGRVGVLHWRSDIPTPRGPDLSIRPRPDKCAAWLGEAGFVLAVPPKVLPPYHFGLVGRVPGA
jgi:SAM-dependent methyltransferase